MDKKDFLRDFRTRGCPICDHMRRAIADFLASWQYLLASNEKIQQEYAAELGFCPLHTWQLALVSSPQGISSGHPKLVEHIASELTKLARTTTDLPNKVLSLFQDSQNCRACDLLRKAEESYVQHLAVSLKEIEVRDAYAHSQGTCLRHLGLLVGTVAETDIAQFLLSLAARRFEKLAEEMKSYAAKHYALRRDLHTQDEKDAYLRALIHIVSARNVNTPFKREV